MKLFRAFSGASLTLLVIHLLLVLAVVATYAWQRQSYPRVWTRAYGYDPRLLLRGRYLSLQPAVDGCSSTLPTAKQALFPRDVNGAIKPGPYTVQFVPVFQFDAMLEVRNGSLRAVYIQNEEQRRYGQPVYAQPGKPCHEMRLLSPVNFYIPDDAPSIYPANASQELWVELTIPPHGPPRPLQLALKTNGNWQPIAYH